MIILLFFLNHFYIKHFKLAFYDSIWNIHKCVYCMKSTSINLPWRRSLMFTQWKCTLILIILILFMGHCIILWKLIFVCEIFYETNAYPAWPLTPCPLSQVSLGESLLEAETVENLDTPVNCFRKLFGTNSSSLYCFIFVLYAFSLSKCENPVFVVHLSFCFPLFQCVTFCRWSWIIQRCVFLSVCCINTCTKQQSFTYVTSRGSRQQTDRCRVKAFLFFCN